jgi:hypothetical protein
VDERFLLGFLIFMRLFFDEWGKEGSGPPFSFLSQLAALDGILYEGTEHPWEVPLDELRDQVPIGPMAIADSHQPEALYVAQILCAHKGILVGLQLIRDIALSILDSVGLHYRLNS